MHVTALQCAIGIALGLQPLQPTPVPPPPGSSSCDMGTSEVKEMFSFMENLYPIKVSWETSTRAACRLPP